MMKKIKENEGFLKSILGLLIIQALLYAFVKLLQSNPHYFVCAWDMKIPFVKEFVYIYDTFYPFFFIVFYFIYKNSKKDYYNSLIATILGVILCDIIFIIYPTIMFRPEINSINNLTDFILNLTYVLDEPAYNCFPSIHCLFCFLVIFNFIKTGYNKRIKFFVIIYSILILLSTLYIKQHYIYDLLAAFPIALIFTIIAHKANLAKKWFPKLL